MDDFLIRELESEDWPAVWSFLQPVFSEGETYAYPTDIQSNEAH